MEYTQHYLSPLGWITLASDGHAITGLWFDGQSHFAETLGKEHAERSLPVFGEASRWLDIFFNGSDPGFTPPLAPKGTPFRRAVWAILLGIPRGKTVSYGEIAGMLKSDPEYAVSIRQGSSKPYARAVGCAVGRNPISLIIPCHRVIGADGRLTGYAGGMERKRRLLALEGIFS